MKMPHLNPKRSFIRSLHPIFVSIRIYGIELDCSLAYSKRRSLAMTIISMIFLASIIVCTFFDAGKIKAPKPKDFTEKEGPVGPPPLSFVRKLVLLLNTVQFGTLSFIPYFSFIIATQTRWKHLYHTIQQIEDSFQSQEVFQKCRKSTLAGVIFLILVTALLMFTSYLPRLK